jgi:hypothetical protein
VQLSYLSAGDLVGEPDLLEQTGSGYVADDIKFGSGFEGDEGEGKLKKHYAFQLADYIFILEQLGLADPARYPYIVEREVPAYREFASSHTDGNCGAAMLAETMVAVPFVSAVVGALAVTQAIRVASGLAHHIGIAGDLGDLRSVRASLGQSISRVIVPNAQAAPEEN